MTEHLGATNPESTQEMRQDPWEWAGELQGLALQVPEVPQGLRRPVHSHGRLELSAPHCTPAQPGPGAYGCSERWARTSDPQRPRGSPVLGGKQIQRVRPPPQPGPACTEGLCGAGRSRRQPRDLPAPRPAPLPARRRASSGRGRRRRAARSCRPGRAGARRRRHPSPGTGPGAGGPPCRPGRAARRRCVCGGSRCCGGGRGSEGTPRGWGLLQPRAQIAWRGGRAAGQPFAPSPL